MGLWRIRPHVTRSVRERVGRDVAPCAGGGLLPRGLSATTSFVYRPRERTFTRRQIIFDDTGSSSEKAHIDQPDLAWQIFHVTDSTTIVRARVPVRRLQRAGEIRDKLGLKPGDAFNMLLAQIELRQGLPFDVRVKPLLSAEEQATAWTEAYGAY